jgi:acyl carrier protein
MMLEPPLKRFYLSIPTTPRRRASATDWSTDQLPNNPTRKPNIVHTDMIYEQLTDLFREIFADDDIALKPETTSRDIEGWDSFNHLTVLVAVETKFGVKMRTDEFDKLVDVGALVTAIESKLKK